MWQAVGATAQHGPTTVKLREQAEIALPEGKHYSDFNASTDKVAAYGLAALVGGLAGQARSDRRSISVSYKLADVRELDQSELPYAFLTRHAKQAAVSNA